MKGVWYGNKINRFKNKRCRENASEKLGNVKDKAVKAMDKNDDGKFDLKDVTQVASSVGGAVKSKTSAMIESATEKARNRELKKLQPIFAGTLVEPEFQMTKLIHICQIEKKHEESELCKDSIGYISENNELKVVNIYSNYTDLFNISFYPNNDDGFYYVDPKDRDRYIAMDEYFNYLKLERINELQQIAKDLGARHFRVTYKEEQESSSKDNLKSGAKVNGKASGETSSSSETQKYSRVEIAAEMQCAGHEPKLPKLHYLQNDTCVANLIKLRMDDVSPITNQKYMIKLSNTSGIREQDAVKIDAVLKGYKASGQISVASEARNEFHRYLEYEVDF